MDKPLLKKKYLAAAAVCAGIITGIVLYTVVVEMLRHAGRVPPVSGPASFILKYFFYILGASAIVALKAVLPRLDVKKPTQEETAGLLMLLAILRAAVCELPAVSGLILFILTGYYRDFYLLALFSIALEIFYFPRLGAWEERLRGDFGQLPD